MGFFKGFPYFCEGSVHELHLYLQDSVHLLEHYCCREKYQVQGYCGKSSGRTHFSGVSKLHQ